MPAIGSSSSTSGPNFRRLRLTPRAVRVTGAVTVQAERPGPGFNLSDFAYALATDGALAYVPFIAPKRILSIVQPGGASRPIPGPPRLFAEGIAVSPTASA